jgi:FkbM family methyltransferase
MKSIKAILRNNQLSRKLLVIKDLILGKLNLIISAVQEADQRTLGVQRSVDLLSENQVYILKSSIDTVHAAHQSIDTVEALRQSILKSESAIIELNQSICRIGEEIQTHDTTYRQLLGQTYAELNQSIRRIGEEIQTHDTTYRQLLGQIYADVHSQKFIMATDPSHFQAIDTELMVFLYSYLPYRLAIDVGANRGDVSERLLQAGFEVYAFEPFPPVLERLQERLANNPNFHSLPYALGATDETRDLHVAADLTENQIYDDPTFYSSLACHSLAEGLVFIESIPVIVKTLAGLHDTGEVPSRIGLVKIDTEGFDLEVIKGMGDFRYPVVVAEFWDPNFPFAQSGAMNYLKDMVPVMRQRGYAWHVIIYRIWGSHDISYYCNSDYSFEKSWGNVFFFRDHAVFSEALKWCNATMPATYFSV